MQKEFALYIRILIESELCNFIELRLINKRFFVFRIDLFKDVGFYKRRHPFFIFLILEKELNHFPIFLLMYQSFHLLPLLVGCPEYPCQKQ